MDGEFLYKGKQLDKGRYSFERHQHLDELWAGDNAKRTEEEKKVADRVVDAEVKVNDALLAELQRQFEKDTIHIATLVE